MTTNHPRKDTMEAMTLAILAGKACCSNCKHGTDVSLEPGDGRAWACSTPTSNPDAECAEPGELSNRRNMSAWDGQDCPCFIHRA